MEYIIGDGNYWVTVFCILNICIVDKSKVIELTQGSQGEVIIEGENGKQEEGLVFEKRIII